MRIALLLTLLACLLPACSGRGSQPPPGPAVSSGDMLEYQVTNTEKGKTTESTLLLTFQSQGDGYLVAVGPDKAPGPALTLNLAPANGQPLGEPDVGLVYLPPGQRREKTQTLAGQVDFKKRWERWEVWVVQVRVGDTAGQRYYDARSGFLVGWDMDLEDKKGQTHKFTRGVLTRSDLL
ncbi:MAG: hypothetical protein AB1758_10975 [Candidatus Eremiobacterota bacterium]